MMPLLVLMAIFAFFDLYFAYTVSPSECMDGPAGILTLRPWLLALGYTQLAIIALNFILGILVCVRCLEERTM